MYLLRGGLKNTIDQKIERSKKRKIGKKSIVFYYPFKPSGLVDSLRVPIPMRAILVRAWVEVVGSVMEFISFQSSMK